MAADRRSRFGVELGAEGEKLRQALQARPTTDVAKGVLMALYGYDEGRAFAELEEVSREHGVALPDLSAALVDLICNGDDPEVDERAAEVARGQWGPKVRSTPAIEVVVRRVLEYASATAAYGARKLSARDGTWTENGDPVDGGESQI